MPGRRVEEQFTEGDMTDDTTSYNRFSHRWRATRRLQ